MKDVYLAEDLNIRTYIYTFMHLMQFLDDSACTRLNGKCQSTSRTCSGGKYVSGKCGGPWNRKCCISSGNV